uniref:Obscurin like cytoskeletal adaptor 1b n=1 Tax=Oncorhynchus tshawytscha TaxID=74940 RepID=A0A8C8FVG4_ONCTS
MDVFGGAPRFLAYPRPVVVQSGTDAVLKCQIGGDPRPAVIWERNNEQIHPEGRYRLFEDGNVYNLIISSVTTEDSGQYTCKAKNSIGETYAAATLKVEGEAQEMELREENKPRFLIKPLSTRVGRGEDAVFSCKLWGNPRPDVVWEKDGRKLNEIFESTHFNVGYQDGGWFQLKIFKTRAPDGGVYTCKARNEFGEGLAGAVLLVDAGPGHEEEGNPKQVKMFAVTEGKHAKFRCFVTGKPKPEIIWRKDGRLIMSGRRYLLYEDREGYFTLKVLYCKQQDNGVYVCAASNTAGQTLSAVHLSVKEPPVRFKQPLIDLEVWERDLAVLECEVPEDSVPITWYLEDRRLQPGAKYGMEEWGTKRRLTIRDIGVDDDGIYLCEMADGGRSIAEVAVKGTIVRKLPRKVDVLEGENAAFCVEVEEEEMDIHWYKEGTELRETHQTILKSFGKTHILVFVNTTPQDSGLVTFFVGRSKTSSQLRVKAARHSPPSCPVGVQINTERANAALLSWVPAQDTRKNPPSGYVLERQEVGTGSQEWLQCLTTDSATSVEILGDSVPCEADYRFRICSVNKYGRSNNVEFPRAVHLGKQKPSQLKICYIYLSIGTLACMRKMSFLTVLYQLNFGQSVIIVMRKMLMIFLKFAAPLVKFTPLSEMDRNKFVELGNPIVLYCELSDPAVPVHWYKNGVEVHTVEGLHIQSEGTMRRIVIQSSEFSHSGVYCCDAIDDVIRFNVEVEDLNISIVPPVRFSVLPEAERNKVIEAGCPIVLKCELSDPTAQVYWYKDGIQLFSNHELDIQSEGNMRTLVVQSAELTHSGTYSCTTVDDTMEFHVDIKAPPVRITTPCEAERNKSVAAGGPIVLRCEISDPNAHVSWYKDGTLLHEENGLEMQSKGSIRTLDVESARLSDSGSYSCKTTDDAMQFHVDVKALPEVVRNKFIEAGCPIVLQCEPNAVVRWYRDGLEVEENDNLILEVDGVYRRLIIPETTVKDSAEYVCDTADDNMTFFVNIADPPVRFVRPRKMASRVEMFVGDSLVLDCEVSRSNATVSWKKNGEEMEESSNVTVIEDGVMRQLTIHSMTLEDAGQYVCDAKDDYPSLAFSLFSFSETPVKILSKNDVNTQKQFFASDDIVLGCELSRANCMVVWYKDNKKIDDNERYCSEEQGVFRSLVVLNAEIEDSGEYTCDAGDDKMVFCITVKVDLVISSTHLVAGDKLILECEISCPNATVQWLWNGKLLSSDARTHIDSDGATRKLVLSGLQPSDSGEYILDAINDKMVTIVEVQGKITRCHVQIMLYSSEPPVKFVNKQARTTISGYENESVTLCAMVNREQVYVRWLKDGELLNGDNIHISSAGKMHTLTINPLKLSDSGGFVCNINTDEMYFIVQNIVALKDSTLTLRCEVNKPKGDVQWLKDGQEIKPSLKRMDLMLGFERMIQCLNDIHCKSTLCVIFMFYPLVPPPTVEIIAELHNITVLEGEDATFKCVVSPEDTQLVWSLNSRPIAPNERFVISSNGLCHMLCIYNCQVSDCATVTAEAEGLVSEANLQVQGETPLVNIVLAWYSRYSGPVLNVLYATIPPTNRPKCQRYICSSKEKKSHGIKT